jgi:signal transduction histidine kinase
MLFLTVLTGLNSFYLTKSWEEATSTVSHQMTETVILNNVHWHLSQIRLKASENPKADLTQNWSTAREQLLLLNSMNTFDLNNQQLRNLQRVNFQLFKDNIIDTKHLNLALLNNTLSQDFFKGQLSKTQNSMETLKTQTQRMIMLISGTLVFLGLILMSITAYDLTRLFIALKQSRDIQMQLQEEERRRIAQDLHDGVVQEMIDLKRHYSSEKIDRIIDNLRRVCHNLKPQILDDLGFSAAISFLVDDMKNYGIQDIHLNMDGEKLNSIPKNYELLLFRILQELCTNIKHHAQASQVKINLVYEPEESHWLSVTIKDNGLGFDPENSAKNSSRQHMGLNGVDERVKQLGGNLTIESSKKKSDDTIEASGTSSGTIVKFQVPIQQGKVSKSTSK